MIHHNLKDIFDFLTFLTSFNSFIIKVHGATMRLHLGFPNNKLVIGVFGKKPDYQIFPSISNQLIVIGFMNIGFNFKLKTLFESKTRF